MRCQRLITSALIALATTPAAFGDTVDKETFEAAARAYRIHIYETHRTNRSEFDRQYEQAREVAKIWNSLYDTEQKQELYNWFVTAKNQGQAGVVPDFVSDPQLVIERPVKPQRQVAATTAVPNGAPQNNFGFGSSSSNSSSSTPSQFPQTMVSQPKKEKKPGFFNALTQALISKPKRSAASDADPGLVATHGGETSQSSDSSSSESTSVVPTVTLDEEIPAEITDETPFEGNEATLAEEATLTEATPTEEALAEDMKLSDDIVRFNVDRDGSNLQLQDQATLTFETFGQAVVELEQLVERYRTLSTQLSALPADQQVAFPELLEVETVIHIAIERTQSPATWLNDSVTAQQQASLADFADRLNKLLDTK